MDHVSSWFQAALLPDRWNVAGVSCGVLTVWHAFVLQQTGNAYNCGGACDRDAAAELLMYCSLDYANGKRLFSQPLFRDRVRRRVIRKMKRHDWPSTHAAVIDYVTTCTRAPSHKQTISQGGGVKSRAIAAPICWVLVDFLAGGDATKIKTAWDTPYALARCLFDARRDSDGSDDSLESLEEEKRIDAFLQAKEAQ